MGLELRDVAKRYGPIEVLHPLSLAVANGEFLTLLGPSGSGKTTVLRLMGGFTEASSGRILFEGEDITRLAANRRPFNTVFQDYALFPHMTVLENAGYGPLVQRRNGAKTARLIDDTLEIVGLSALRDRYPAQLSGGQKQRVALARAIVCEPKVILLDEPLAALDATLRRQMQLFLKQIQRRIETTFVFVTHDQDEAIAMSDRIVVMSQGSIEQIGSPKELYFKPRTRFVAGFFGDNNLIPGVTAGTGKVQSAIGELPCTDMSGIRTGQDVLLCIRPESLKLGQGMATIQAEVEEAIFGGAMTKLILHATADPSVKLDLRLSGGRGAVTPNPGDVVSVTYDPADAVMVTRS
ncbi:ABC transporter ATP-binding protein [Nordella sp. HKS 07]|uniref:ABC transporter ATP-binding protein n=1 Tax=Nordella sp. HKS 07 TaxID=2712222 RepID=UPI0013E1E577|nr:ABC transporter ATP-binding protein [Nordella sp. HKS 07]QIG52236.1 ABC transporter ATP-binding protein [Nordella sp. HKS 07]